MLGKIVIIAEGIGTVEHGYCYPVENRVTPLQVGCTIFISPSTVACFIAYNSYYLWHQVWVIVEKKHFIYLPIEVKVFDSFFIWNRHSETTRFQNFSSRRGNDETWAVLDIALEGPVLPTLSDITKHIRQLSTYKLAVRFF